MSSGRRKRKGPEETLAARHREQEGSGSGTGGARVAWQPGGRTIANASTGCSELSGPLVRCLGWANIRNIRRRKTFIQLGSQLSLKKIECKVKRRNTAMFAQCNSSGKSGVK